MTHRRPFSSTILPSVLLAATPPLLGCGGDEGSVEKTVKACVIMENRHESESADETIDSIRTRTFDEAGRVVREDQDTRGTFFGAPADGRSESYVLYSYDAMDRVIRMDSYDFDTDQLLYYSTREYDERGRQTRERDRVDAEGQATNDITYRYGNHGIVEYQHISYFFSEPSITRSDYIRNQRGQLVRIDSFQDGELSYQEELRYSSSGVVKSSLATYHNELGISSVKKTTYEFRDDGKIATEFFDNDNDGSIDGRTDYLYDEEGRLLSEESDCDGDGIADWRITKQYDAEGRLTKEVRGDTSHSGEGFLTTTYDYSCYE